MSRRAHAGALVALLLWGLTPPAAAHPPDPGPGRYANPVLDADFPDPMVVRAPDGWYYAYATGSGATKVAVSRSRDLVRWSRPREAMPAKPRWARKKGKFWAPHVVRDGRTWRMYLTVEPDWSASEHMRLAVLEARHPLGPFVDRGVPMATGDFEENLDAMAFRDPATGRRWLYWGANGEITVQALAPDGRGFAAGAHPLTLLRPLAGVAYESVVEGPWVVARDGWYYLFYSGDDCCESYHYGVSVARSRSATGPFERRSAAPAAGVGPILMGGARWKGPGHNAVWQDTAGTDWLVYHAVDARQPTDPKTGHVRRPMLIDRLVWRDGWPQVASGEPSEGPRPAPKRPGRAR